MRISGLASGMDIDSIVKDMMKAQRVPLDKLKQNKQTLEWQRDDYRSINTQLLNFRNSLLNMKLTSAYRVRQVNSSDDSKVSATASSAASLSSYSVSRINKLAEPETWINKNGISDSKINLEQSLYSQKDQLNGKGQFDSWDTGAVLSQTLKGDGSKAYSLKDEGNLDLSQLNNWSVKVDGKSFILNSTGTDLKENEFSIDSNGEILFGKKINSTSDIQVNYIGKLKTESLPLSNNPSSVQLSQKAINSVSSFTIKKNEGGISTNYATYNVDDKGIITDSKEPNKRLGALNKDTGLIEFDDKAMPLSSDKVSYSIEIKYDQKYTNFSLNTTTSQGEKYENFIITGNDSLKSIMSKVNNSSVGVSLFYDDYSNKFTMTRSETGIFSKPVSEESNGETVKTYEEIKGSGSFFTDILGFNGDTIKNKAQNASFTINGLDTERTTNTFEMNGVTFTLKQTFNNKDEDSKVAPISIGISNDSSKVYENITKFIQSYNELIEKIQGKLDEKRNRSYSPLTDEQKESLSDKQQEKWEEIAKAGLLRHDSTLSSVLSNLRTDFYATVQNSAISSAYNQLSKIGITTSSDYLSGGKLEINEAKLKKALEENPESVEQLFRGENGIMSRLTTSLTKGMDAVKLKAGNDSSTNQTFTIGRELDNLDKRVDTFENRMKDLEDRYYRQFTAMEQAIQKANSQSNYLYSFFSNGN